VLELLLLLQPHAINKSPSKRELVKLVEAQGKSRAESAFEYDPAAPLRGLSRTMASLDRALGSMLELVKDILTFVSEPSIQTEAPASDRAFALQYCFRHSQLGTNVPLRYLFVCSLQAQLLWVGSRTTAIDGPLASHDRIDLSPVLASCVLQEKFRRTTC